MTEYKIECLSLFEVGQRKDAEGNPHQEDCLFPASGQEDETSRLFILCDGMGGHEAGEVASATVCEAMSRYLLSLSGDGSFHVVDNDINRAIDAAYNALDAVDKSPMTIKKMGTTMTCLALHDEGATIAHIGDSRVYHIRPGNVGQNTKILSQTQDHSLVNDLISIGKITPQEAINHPRRNVITRAMQPHQECRSTADFMHISDIKAGDYFYMCSDGMLERMDNEELCHVFARDTGGIEAKKRILIEATEENKDNHSAFFIHIIDIKSSTSRRILSFPLWHCKKNKS